MHLGEEEEEKSTGPAVCTVQKEIEGEMGKVVVVEDQEKKSK